MKNFFVTFLKPKIRNISFLLLVVAGSIGAARFCHYQTKGFRISKILDNLSTFHESPDLKNENAEAILSQKFRFFSRGLQSFVFLSEDGNYVLKVFNNGNKKLSQFYSLCKRVPRLSSWALFHEILLQEKEARTFASYELAEKEMKDQTALIYLHTKKTSHLPSAITLIDPLNISHEINPNELGFLIQKKVGMAYPTLEMWIKKGDLLSAKSAISSLLQLFSWKWKHGFNDSDPLIRTNYGFIGTQAIQIDVGPLSRASNPLSFQEFSCELKRITASLRVFLSSSSPELVTYLDRELDELLSSEG